MLPLWHVTFATSGRRAAWRDRGAALTAVRTLAEVLGETLLCFGLVDEHGHVGLAGPMPGVRARVGGAMQALSHRLDLALEPARIRPVHGRRHLENVLGYCLRQAEHHGVETGPATSLEATSLPDLLGARRLPGFDPDALRAQLPRLSDAQLARRAGRTPLVPVTRPAAPLHELVDAGAAACGRLSLRGKSRDVLQARAAVATLARRAHFPVPAIAEALGVGRSAAYRAVSTEAPDAWLRAVGCQLALRGHSDLRTPEDEPAPPLPPELLEPPGIHGPLG